MKATCKLLMSGVVLAICQPGPAAWAQRVETTSPAQVSVFDTCPLTPASALESQRAETKEILPLLAAVFAGIAGELVKDGLNAIGTALDHASREQGFVSEGVGNFAMGTVRPRQTTADNAQFVPKEHCIVLYAPAKSGAIDQLLTDPAIIGDGTRKFDWLNNADARALVLDNLKQHGMTAAPALYVEAVLLPSAEGMRVRPTLVWYNERLPGAPGGQTSAELHVMLGTPLYAENAAALTVGAPFAGVRLQLPPVGPGKVLDWTALRTVGQIAIPNRPTGGFVDQHVEALNTAYAALVTKQAELTKAQRTVRRAQAALAAKPGADAQDALAAAREQLDDAKAEFDLAEFKAAVRVGKPAGVTNVLARFVVVRDANKFGLAIAKAISGQADNAAKAVTDRLTPKPDWGSSQTQLVTASVDVEAKQRAYADALAKADAAAIATTAADLRIAKAKANEAAASAGQPIPYPGLLSGTS